MAGHCFVFKEVFYRLSDFFREKKKGGLLWLIFN